jgi:hypothetical protein
VPDEEDEEEEEDEEDVSEAVTPWDAEYPGWGGRWRTLHRVQLDRSERVVVMEAYNVPAPLQSDEDEHCVLCLGTGYVTPRGEDEVPRGRFRVYKILRMDPRDVADARRLVVARQAAKAAGAGAGAAEPAVRARRRRGQWFEEAHLVPVARLLHKAQVSAVSVLFGVGGEVREAAGGDKAPTQQDGEAATMTAAAAEAARKRKKKRSQGGDRLADVFFAVGVGQKLLLYQWLGTDLEQAAFYQARFWVSALASARNYLMVGDAFFGGELLAWDNDTRELRFVARDGLFSETTAVACVASDRDLVLLASEGDGTLRMSTVAWNERGLLQNTLRIVGARALGSVVTCMRPLPTFTLRAGMRSSRERERDESRFRVGAMVCDNDGRVSLLLPLPRRTAEFLDAAARNGLRAGGLRPGASLTDPVFVGPPGPSPGPPVPSTRVAPGPGLMGTWGGLWGDGASILRGRLAPSTAAGLVDGNDLGALVALPAPVRRDALLAVSGERPAAFFEDTLLETARVAVHF